MSLRSWLDLITAVPLHSKPPRRHLVADASFAPEHQARKPTHEPENPPMGSDGKPHKVTGHSYYDEASATVVSPQVVELHTTLAGKKSGERTLTVSADGKSMRVVDEDRLDGLKISYTAKKQ